MVNVFHLGPRNCGKSLFVEKQLASLSCKLYIGTLTAAGQCRDVIDAHQKRRDGSWKLFEITPDFFSDMAALRNMLIQTPGVKAVMLDGIIVWFKQIEERFPGFPVDFFSEALVELVRSNEIDWYLVDVYPRVYTGSNYSKYQQIHNKLIDKLNIEIIRDWNYE